MKRQVAIYIVIALIAFVLGVGLMLLLGQIDRGEDSADTSVGMKQEVPIAVEIEPEAEEPLIWDFFGRQIEGIKVPIGEIEGGLGEIKMTQEFYDALAANPSCEIFSEFSGSASYGLSESPEAKYVLPWTPGEYTNCEYIQQEGAGYFLFVSLQAGYDGFISLTDGIMIMRHGDFYVLDNIHSVADWKEKQIFHEIQEDFPPGDLGTPEFNAHQNAYWEALTEYFTEPNGEIYWTMEMLKEKFK